MVQTWKGTMLLIAAIYKIVFRFHKIDPEVKALKEENARLKKIIGNQALELEFKTELLKKSNAHERSLKGLSGITRQRAYR